MSSPADLQPDVGVVVVAAGAGVRAGPGEPKQFRPILGVPMLLRALRPFTGHPAVRQVIVALPPGYAERPPEWLGKLRGDRLRLVPGGAQRADSVRAGLDALPADSAIILVHDAARPFVSRDTIDAVIARARAGVGAVAAVPTSDTLWGGGGGGGGGRGEGGRTSLRRASRGPWIGSASGGRRRRKDSPGRCCATPTHSCPKPPTGAHRAMMRKCASARGSRWS